jgi:transcriptional regulator with XRE-family HTH domain
MEKTKLIHARKVKGLTAKEIADLLSIEEYSYRRREKGDTKIARKEWKRLAEILEVEFDEIFEPDYYPINCNNGEGQINNDTHKIEYYNIPKEMVENQQEFIALLKSQIETLKQENQTLKNNVHK